MMPLLVMGAAMVPKPRAAAPVLMVRPVVEKVPPPSMNEPLSVTAAEAAKLRPARSSSVPAAAMVVSFWSIVA